MSESRMREQQEAWREIRRFIVLTGVLMGAVLIVLFSRPFIFDRVVPALLGSFLSGQPRQMIVKPLVNEAPRVQPVEADVDSDDVVPVEADIDVDETAPAVAEPVDANTGATIVEPTTAQPVELAPPPEPVEYTVRTGDNLTAIAEAHGVTVTALLQANSLANPNLIKVGDVLLVPLPATE
jgi:LysM repeat protein